MSIDYRLKLDARRQKILERLRRDGRVNVAELSDDLHTSTVTIRNDLDSLEQSGFLQRIQGGAVLSTRNYYNNDFQLRIRDRYEIKKGIAIKTSSIINNGETLIINSGSTSLITAIELRQHKNLNVVTNSIAVALELDSQPTFRVILLGGEINAQYGFTHGADAQEQLKRYKADKAILAVDGISAETGLTTYHAEEAIIIRTMMDRSRECIIVADSSKYCRESFSRISSIDRVSCWVTDCNLENEAHSVIENRGIKLITADGFD
jgi:DeoR/GlpR family transcriptional regulator of sugar metabolism